jgi:hypothetical protein
MQAIAEEELTARFPNGRTSRISIRLAAPTAQSGSEWACQVQLAGLSAVPYDASIRGEGSWNSLMIGIGFVRNMLSAYIDRGVVFYWPDSDVVADMDTLFAQSPSTRPGTEDRNVCPRASP